MERFLFITLVCMFMFFVSLSAKNMMFHIGANPDQAHIVFVAIACIQALIYQRLKGKL